MTAVQAEQFETALHGSAAWIFEAVVALSPHPARGEALVGGLAAEILFAGPLRGRLRVRLCERLLPVAAARMLGEDTPPDAAIQRDALGEIANLICGALLPRLVPEAVFEMSPPRVLADGPPAEEPPFVARLGLPEGRLDVGLALDA